MAVSIRNQTQTATSGEQLPSALGPVGEDASPEVPLAELSLSERMAEIARILREQSHSSESLLTAVTQFAVQQVPGVDAACVTQVDGRGQHESPVVVGEIARKIAELQQELGQGPLVDAEFSTMVIHVPNVATDPRWPAFSEAAARLGVGSVLCCCLYLHNDAYGALTLLAQKPNAFDEDAISIGSLFAVHAAVAFSAVRETEQIRAALTTRDEIGQAKGMIMERYKLDADGAFRLLARLSQDSNIKLSEVAKQVVEAGPE